MKSCCFGSLINVFTIALISIALTFSAEKAMADADDPVVFADEILQDIIEYKLGVTNPTEADMLDLTDLNIDDESYVVDITGLEYAINLEHLNIANPYITDFANIENLTKLTYLNLSHTNISSISFLDNMPNMEQLNLSGTNTVDISSLGNLTNLTYLMLTNNPLNEEAYQLWLPTIETNNPTIYIRYNKYTGHDAVLFISQNLKLAVEEALGIINPTPADMLNLTSLTHIIDDSDYLDISNLTGLEYAVNLEYLDLTNNSINNHAALASLTKLRYLDLRGTYVDDLSPIANLTALEELYLDDSNIDDLSPLSNITTLTHLQLSNIRIDDMAGLAGLTNIIWLDLSRSSIEDLTPLLSMPNLSNLNLNECDDCDFSLLTNMTALTELNMDFCKVSDLTPLANLINLSKLSLISNEISDLSPLENISNLTHLSLHFNNINDISSLSRLTDMIELNISGNTITDFSPLASMTVLTGLNIGQNNISDLSTLPVIGSLTTLSLKSNVIDDLLPLANMTGLENLDICFNNINDLGPLAGMTSLENLELAYNSISDISPLSGMGQLSYLNLSNNNISLIPLLDNMGNLSELNLRNNSIINVDNLSDFISLEQLYMAQNNISDVSPLANLENLIYLSIPNNNISDISSFVNSTNLETLYIYNNPLSAETYLTWITEIQNNNPNVYINYNKYTGSPAVMVKSPNGLEQIPGNREIEIHWGSLEADSVTVHYSIDNGASWTFIAEVPTEDVKDNVYYWRTPQINSDECLIKVANNDMTAIDISNEPFSIYQCILGNNDGDTNNDCRVDIYDFAALAENWMMDGTCLNLYYDFENGLPADTWSYNSVGSGFIQALDGKLRMEALEIGEGSLNEAILHIDLTGRSNVVLSFWQKSNYDERDYMSSYFNGSHNGDGVAISSDGIYWKTIADCIELDTGPEGKMFTFNLDDKQVEYTSNFQIKFQQYDNCTWPVDGRCWDNIRITSSED